VKSFQNEKSSLDAKDLAILKCLQTDPRLGIADLARQVELSAPTVRDRLQRLVAIGVIRRWWIEIDPRALGYPVCVYIRVRPMPGQLNKIAALANELPQVVEAHRVTGEDCFIIKAYIKALENLDQLLDRFLAFGQTTTSIVQSSPVLQRGLPVPVSRGARRISRKADFLRRPVRPHYGGQAAPSPPLTKSARGAKTQR
jgi:Lrp/AsnC family transcriptional regulator, leucine-responsive regulatory protein